MNGEQVSTLRVRWISKGAEQTLKKKMGLKKRRGCGGNDRVSQSPGR